MEEEICSAQKKQRDLRVDTLKIGGKDVVRDVVILTPRDVIRKVREKKVFKLSYRVFNDGYMGAKDFENVAYFNDKIASQQQKMALGPNASKLVETETILDIKDGVLLVRIDAFSRIQEDDETNNDISSMVLFKGFQKGYPQEPFLHVELLRIAKKAPQQGRIKLTKKDSIGMKKGRVGFELEYVIRNFGLKPAVDFCNLYLLKGKRFFRQPKLSLGAGESRLVKLPVYFPVANGKFTLRADSNMKYPKGPDCNQTLDIQLFFQGFKNPK